MWAEVEPPDHVCNLLAERVDLFFFGIGENKMSYFVGGYFQEQLRLLKESRV